MSPNIPMILDAILEDYALPWNGNHGVAHWARVLENGRCLAQETGAMITVVELFAVLHDARRINEGTDPDHGPRAALFAEQLRAQWLVELSDSDFQLLHRACSGHTHERTHPDITIQTCWDADRLDLGRVGITPDPRFLCSDAAKRREMIVWADGRAISGVVPEFVEQEWGLDIAPRRAPRARRR